MEPGLALIIHFRILLFLNLNVVENDKNGYWKMGTTNLCKYLYRSFIAPGYRAFFIFYQPFTFLCIKHGLLPRNNI